MKGVVAIWALAGVFHTLLVWGVSGTWGSTQAILVAGLWFEDAICCGLTLVTWPRS